MTGRPPDGDGPSDRDGPPGMPQSRTAADDLASGSTAAASDLAAPTRQPGADAAGGRGSPRPPAYDHRTLTSLLGAWALSACSDDEAFAVDDHIADCAGCAGEALRLRDAVGLLHQPKSLELEPRLRVQVLEDCLARRPAGVPFPDWAGPYDAETARLDAFLGDLGDPEWDLPVRLAWAQGERTLTLCGVLAHLGSVDGLVGTALGLEDPLGPGAPRTVTARTELAGERCRTHPHPFVRDKWRTQSREIVRTVSFAGSSAHGRSVDFTDFTLPVRDALIDRAFECWIHAEDIAGALDYPYPEPAPDHLHRMIDMVARLLPGVLAKRRRAGLAVSSSRLAAAGAPGRSLCLEVEGKGGGRWHIAVDSPTAPAGPDGAVAHLAVDSVDFCRLTAGHLAPERIAIGQEGDQDVVRDVLFAASGMSRL